MYRRADIKKDDSEVLSPPLPPTSNILLQSSSLRPRTGQEWKNNQLAISAPYLRRIRSAFSSPDAIGVLTPSSSVSTEGNSDAWDFISRRSASVNSCERPSSEMVADLSLLSFARPEGSQIWSEFQAFPHSEVGLCHLSPLHAQVHTKVITDFKFSDNLSSNHSQSQELKLYFPVN